ncbi:MAG: hypothetical protein GY765_13950, partial [bacterium]|nr:hypothetical protein [bacterium]
EHGFVSDTNDSFFIVKSPEITVTSPLGAEEFFMGTPITITWTSAGVVDNVILSFSFDGGQNWETIEGPIPNSGIYDWILPNIPSPEYMVMVEEEHGFVSDTNDSFFNVKAPEITVTSPTGAEEFFMGTPIAITWTSAGVVENVILSFSFDGGQNWEPIEGPISNSGTYDWILPNQPSPEYLVMVEHEQGFASDTNDSFFIVKAPEITVTSPMGAEEFFMGTPITITWTSAGVVDNVVLSYSWDGGQNWEPIEGPIPNSGTYNWILPNQPSPEYLVMVEEEHGFVSDTNDPYFTVKSPEITVTSPLGGEEFFMGTPVTVTWTSAGVVDNVVLSYSWDGGQNFEPIEGPIPNSGAYDWILPNQPSTEYLVLVGDEHGFVADANDAFFTVKAPEITVTSPLGGEEFFMGTPITVTWTSAGVVNNVALSYSRDGGEYWTPIAGPIPNSGTYDWILPNQPSTEYLVKVEEERGFVNDTNDTFFTVKSPEITVTAPNGGESFFMGMPLTILWSSAGPVNNVMLTYSSDGGFNWNLIAGPVPNNGTYDWTLPNQPSTEYLVRVEEENGFASDTNDALFAVTAPTLHLLTPNGGERWVAGTEEDITWESAGIINNVNLSYSIDGGETLLPVGLVPNTGTYTWTVPVVATTEAVIVVEDEFAFVSDGSDAFFTLAPDAIPALEREALIALYTGTDGDNWTDNSNWRKPGEPTQFNDPGTEDSWFGVTVNASLNQVERIDLSNNGLNGTLPAELNNLTQLQSLKLYVNSISGTIPQLGGLTNLTELYLHDCALTGSIPSVLGTLTSLQVLYLKNNSLSGSLPPELGNLTALTELFVQANMLSGPIPVTLTALTVLPDGKLDIRWNALSAQDAALRTFLDAKQVGGYWEDSQTTPPAGVTVDGVTESSVSLSWTPIMYQADGGGYRVSYSTVSGSGYVEAGLTAGKAVDNYTVTGLDPGTTYYFIVETVTAAHVYNQNSVVSQPAAEITADTEYFSITVTSPNGGEVWEAGSPMSLTWTTTGGIGNVAIEYSTDNGAGWDIITPSTTNDGFYPWTVPNLPSTTCLIRISDGVSGAADISDAVFTILEPRSITVSTPNGGEELQVGFSKYILWNSTGAVSTVSIAYSLDGGDNWTILHSSHPNGGVYNWINVPDVPSENCLVRISDTESFVSDTSDAPFTIWARRISPEERAALIALYNNTGGDLWPANGNWRKTEYPYGFNDPGTEHTWYGVTTNTKQNHVTGLELRINNLEGTLPAELNALTELTVLRLDNNRISGTLPDLSGLTKLTHLELGSNMLTGTLPAWINNFSNLKVLSLYVNSFNGTLPDISNLTQLETLNLNHNYFTGSLPAALSQLTKLESIYVPENQLSGTVPDLTQLTLLTTLNLSDNQFSGNIPDVSNSTALRYFYLGTNQFSGTIPAWVNNLSQL